MFAARPTNTRVAEVWDIVGYFLGVLLLHLISERCGLQMVHEVRFEDIYD